jgi:membrane protease YdiL (CAAX protease family)
VTEGPVDAPELAAGRRWGLGDVVAGWVGGQALAVVVGSIVAGATGRDPADLDTAPLYLQFLPQLGLWLGLLGVPLLVTSFKGRGPGADLRLRGRAADLWKGGVLGIACQWAVIPLYWPILKLLDKRSDELDDVARQLVDRVHGAGNVALIVVWVVVLAPVIEEIFFRGLLQRSLVKRGLPPVAVIVVTGLVFGASHLEPLQFPALALFGMVLAWMAHRTGRLGPSIAAHMGFNLVTVIALLGSR